MQKQGELIMSRDTKKTSDIDELLQEELKNPSFAKAWEETELEEQVKRMLIQARIDSGLTQKELAAKSGIRQSNISRIENGDCVPTLTTLHAIARGTGRRLKIEMV